MEKNITFVRATDSFLSRERKISPRIVFRTDKKEKEKGNFTLYFLLTVDLDILERISNFAEDMKEPNVELKYFFEEGGKAKEILRFDVFPKWKKIRFGNFAPEITSGGRIIHYVGIIFSDS